jgi:hypothetical protein
MNDPESTRTVSIAELLQLVLHCTDLVSHEAAHLRAGEPASLVVAIRALRAKRGEVARVSAIVIRTT